jgi:iron(III) transport system substrate-binding protein
MFKQLPLFCALAAVLLGPLALRPRSERGDVSGVRELVIVTPHDQAIREEFARAFSAEHLRRTKERVHVDWRTPGGTSEAGRYIDSEFFGAFQNYWSHTLARPWNELVAINFANSQIAPAASPDADTPEQQARRAFLESNVGCGIDVFFGGGAFDFAREAADGRLVDSGVVATHPELFNEKAIPESMGGEKLRDAQGRWIGVCLSAFGICSNRDSLRRLGLEKAPRQWADLADPRLFHEVAVANPTQSGSVNRAFELLIQQQISETIEARKQADGGAALAPEAEAEAVRAGWERALRLLMKIGANARYFTDSSSKIALDVAAGEAAAGMSIDFYGRFESEAVERPDGSSRLEFVNAEGGTSFSPDTIGLLRGAPHADLAREFIAWTLSPEGQKLWDWKVGAPGGPVRYSLRRLPILPALYAPEWRTYRADPEVDPYAPAKPFTYHGAWTGPLFNAIAYTVRVMCIDPHDELAEAWRALIDAHFPPEAMAAFSNVEPVGYETAKARIRPILGRDKIAEVQLAKELADHFRQQYERAAMLARQGK